MLATADTERALIGALVTVLCEPDRHRVIPLSIPSEPGRPDVKDVIKDILKRCQMKKSFFLFCSGGVLGIGGLNINITPDISGVIVVLFTS